MSVSILDLQRLSETQSLAALLENSELNGDNGCVLCTYSCALTTD